MKWICEECEYYPGDPCVLTVNESDGAVPKNCPFNIVDKAGWKEGKDDE